MARSAKATILGVNEFESDSPNITASGFFQVSPSICAAAGAGVIRLTTKYSRLHRQNTHHACIMNGMPSSWLMNFSVPKTGRSRTKDMAPIKKPKIRVARAACLVPRRQKTPHKKTVVIGGARSAAITLIASKMLEYLPPCVDHKM